MDHYVAGPAPQIQQSQRFAELLEPVLATIRADGYEASVAVDDSSHLVTVTIEASPTACAECLVPEEVIRMILADALTDAAPGAGSYTVHVTMPATYT